MSEINVTSWAEFLAAVGTDYATVNCPENAVWDMNEIAPEGTTIRITCSEINGNGTTIKNANINDTFLNFYVSGTVVTSLNIADFVASTYVIWGNNTTFRGCRFSGYQNAGYFCNGSATFGTTSGAGAKGCGLTIHSNGGSLSNGDLNLDCAHIHCTGAPSSNQWVNAKNCLFTGDFGTLPFSTSNWYNVINATGTFNAPYGVNTCVINSDLATSYTGSQMHGVTTAQLGDADYLLSLGFPIGVKL